MILTEPGSPKALFQPCRAIPLLADGKLYAQLAESLSEALGQHVQDCSAGIFSDVLITGFPGQPPEAVQRARTSAIF